jgi:hypothetical protein
VSEEPRRYLLAVGIAEYEDWPNLSEALQEVERVVALLTSPPYKFERILQKASESPHIEDLVTQLAKWANSHERHPADQLVIYWTGHGEEHHEKLHLVLSNSSSRPLTRTILAEKLVESALPEGRIHGGILFLLDVCYSGQGALDLGERFGALIRARSSANAPEIALLCASRSRERAKQNAFSKAFVSALQQCELEAPEHEPQLYLNKLLVALRDGLPDTQRPVLSDQSNGATFFVNPKYQPGRPQGYVRDAIMAKQWAANELEVVIIAQEHGSEKLVNTAQAALNRLRRAFKEKSGKVINDPPVIQRIDMANAFDGEDRLIGNLRPLCRADLVIADVTKDAHNNHEPGLMLLLGIRSVARRGITICSVDIEPDELYSYNLPYNLTYLNLSSHADPHRDGPRLLSRKIWNGFDQHTRNPSYLDLPPFDAIRNLGSSPDDYLPIDFDRGPLYLGPFNKDFEKKCFRPIEEELITSLDGLAKERLGRNYTEDAEPRVRRLLDRSATQLVAHSLYEAIRRHNFCIVDWSQMRANVFFELGIRLAASEQGAVNIVARGYPLNTGLKQVLHLSKLFQPIIYNHDGYEQISSSVKEILRRREAKWAKQFNARIYREIAEAAEPEAREAIAKLRGELSTRAQLAYFDDQDTRRTTVLHADRNQEVQRAAISTSIGLHLCALTLRYGLEADVSGHDRLAFKHALAMQAERIRDLAESGGKARDIEALKRICNLLDSALNI